MGSITSTSNPVQKSLSLLLEIAQLHSQRFGHVDKRLESLEGHMKSMESRMGKIEADVGSLQSDVSELKTMVREIHQRVVLKGD